MGAAKIFPLHKFYIFPIMFNIVQFSISLKESPCIFSVINYVALICVWREGNSKNLTFNKNHSFNIFFYINCTLFSAPFFETTYIRE